MKHETCELNRGNNVSVPYIVASGFCFIEQELDRIMVRNAVSADERGRTARWVSGEGFETKLDQLGLAYIMIKKRKAGKGGFPSCRAAYQPVEQRGSACILISIIAWPGKLFLLDQLMQ